MRFPWSFRGMRYCGTKFSNLKSSLKEFGKSLFQVAQNLILESKKYSMYRISHKYNESNHTTQGNLTDFIDFSDHQNS
jgi:hypothetical protein